MDNNTDLEFPYDSYLEVTLAEIKKRHAEILLLEGEEALYGQHPYWIMGDMLTKKEGLDKKQASDYVFDFCARKAPEEIEGVGRMRLFDPPEIIHNRKPWWCFWKR